MAETPSATEGREPTNPPCPHCGEPLHGDDLEALKCPGCGQELPPRLGI